jgi:hypothetical protein
MGVDDQQWAEQVRRAMDLLDGLAERPGSVVPRG